ncbi:hypothetical protein DFH29DRAFT_102180 [Suillus ampliporus]|nr:hypothetical protein DFH29DRAFT_102180 [Suillus ampliporus]
MSSSMQDLIPQLNLESKFGALFIGVTIAAIRIETQRTFYKLVVIGLWILNALHLALIIHCVYYYLVNNYGNIGALTEIVWSFKLQIIIDVVLIYGVHIMYTYRIWIVSRGRSRALPITVVIIIVLVSGPAVVAAWSIYQCHSFTDLIRTEWSTFMAFGMIAFVDVVIASSLCYLLATSHMGFSR